jgi:predicted short-subunit dehydrogenase-like oxidoreductase (DUF2520 family)
MRNVAIVGAGKVGTVLGRLLVDGGVKITCVVSRTRASAQAAGRFLRCRNVSNLLNAIPASTDLVYITTPHAAVGTVADGLSRLDHLKFQRLAVCHASGMLTAEVLGPVRRRGATVFSFHPLQTFPRDLRAKDLIASARAIYYAVDGDLKALKRAKGLARRLGGKVIEIEPAKRAFYHASCVVASNHVTTLLSILERMFGKYGPAKQEYFKVFRPIVMATLANVEAAGPARSLSGPVERGGVETVAEHLSAVRQFAPELLPYFGTLTLETVNLALAKGSIGEERASALKGLVQSFIHQS